MDISPTFPLAPIWGFIKRLWWRVVRPSVEFLAPVPGTYFSTTVPDNESRWYVPIRVKRALLIGRIESATVRILPAGENQFTGISMRWYSRDQEMGTAKLHLQPGQLYWVPFAIRDSARPDGFAIITNESWLKNKEEKWKVGNVADWYMEVHSGEDVWKSGHSYRLRVPIAGKDNSHFVLNSHYGNVY